jgi:hypothetical protein
MMLPLMILCTYCLHRITLTYNLHQVDAADAAAPAADLDLVNETAFGRSLQSKLKDEKWFPASAKLGFILEHRYAAGEAHSRCFS